MQFKRLEIHGFKSFADRTAIDFLPGITAVVGPNGSGKSNVSDALLWVLGEQNPRNLRGEGSTDLIFSGTDRRRPMGMAEVSLQVDNDDRSLPLDFNEVTITRRVYRSGEGEFLINRVSCRLKDIYELFLDTGVGRDAYSIIGQNQIHAVLSARGEERRELLEEAAGIKKYRHRRREATKRLESTRQNLVRVADILHELEGQVEPLAIQADAARQWRDLEARLRELEVGLLAIDLLRKEEERVRIRDEKRSLERELEANLARLEREEAVENEARHELSRLEGAVESLRKIRDEARETVIKLEGRQALLRQQAVSDAADRLRLVSDQTRQEARIEEVASEAAAIEKESTELADRMAEGERRAAGEIPRLREMEIRVREAADQLERRRKRVLEETASKAAAEARIREIETQRRDGADGEESERRRLEESRRGLERAREREEEIAREVAAARERQASLLDEIRAQNADRRSAAEARDAAEEAVRKRRSRRMERAARLQSLEEMHRSLEGAYRGVRSVIQAARKGELAGEYLVVADLLRVPPPFAVAIEVALGAHAQDILTPTDREARAAIEHLKRRSAGRATFLPLDLIRGDRMRPASGTGIQGVAIDLIEFPEDSRPAIEMLLGRVLVVDNMETAVRLLREPRASGRMVTLEGELIHPNGSITGGSREGNPGILSRKLEIDRLREEVEGESRALEAEEELSRAAIEKWKALEVDGEALRNEAAALRVEMARAESALEHAGAETRRRETELAESEKRLATAGARFAKANRDASDLTESLEKIAVRLTEETKREAEAERVRTERNREWESLRAASSEAALERERSRERLKRLGDRQADRDREMRDARALLESIAESLFRIDERRERDNRQEEALSAEIAVRRQAVETATERLESRVRERAAGVERMEERANRRKALSAEREAAQDRHHRLEVRDAGLLSDADHLRQRLRDDYDAEIGSAPALASAVTSRQNIAVEVNRLKREMLSLGTVNLGAIDEHARISERVAFLSEQKTDLEEAEATLLRVISDIDAMTQEAFMTTFDRVAAAFDVMFRRLFDGGRTRLVLTDPGNVLETGIDIIVQPPGKKLQHLQLLSGGEKALTAVALLFALLEVKPSPFCLLDEVDAALDEANVSRFAEVVRDFAARSQFVIITHNKATMAASDTLVGVTMEDPGVSKLLSVRLEEGPTGDSEERNGFLSRRTNSDSGDASDSRRVRKG